MHESVAAHLDPKKIADVYLYGSEMAHLYKALEDKFEKEHLHIFKKEEKELLKSELSNQLAVTDTVFLKGSNGMGLSEIVEYLLNNQFLLILLNHLLFVKV